MQVHRNEQAQSFEITRDGERAALDYEMQGPDLALTHTYVPDAWRGQGVAQKLAEAALNYARENNFKVLPYCPFVRKFIERHEAYQDLENSSFQTS